MNNLSTSDKLKRLMKYIIQTLVVYLAARYIPINKIKNKEVIMIALVSTICFAILDIYSPSVNI